MRRRRNRSTWFPILGFEVAESTFTTVDIRELSVNNNGVPSVTVTTIINDIDRGSQNTITGFSLRDQVEGQTCIIDRIVGKIVIERDALVVVPDEIATIIACAAIAVLPTDDDGLGNPALTTADLDPLNPNNSANPWLWRRTWILGASGSDQVGGRGELPPHNLFGSVAEGSHVDTKGTHRAIRREERIFLIYSLQAAFPSNESVPLVNSVRAYADLRVVGRMTKARNKGSFK